MSETRSGPAPSGAARLADALDALVSAIGAAHAELRAAPPALRALIDEHAFWEENFLWTDGTQVERAAERIARPLRDHAARGETR